MFYSEYMNEFYWWMDNEYWNAKRGADVKWFCKLKGNFDGKKDDKFILSFDIICTYKCMRENGTVKSNLNILSRVFL